jgi:hypothetical protein
MSLTNDSDGNVISANFTFTPPKGKGKTWQTNIPWPGNPPVALAPFYAFTLNIVGQNGGVCAYLSSGSGLISFICGEALSVYTDGFSVPFQLEQPGEFTVEESNSAYQPLQDLPFDPTIPVTQSFWANTTNTIYRPGAPFAVSQQIGMGNQTNLYAVCQSGNLMVFSVVDGGHWNETALLGQDCMFHPLTTPAASELFGGNSQSNVFVMGQNEQLYTFFTQGTGGWSEPIPIGPANIISSRAYLAASQQFGISNQTDVFLVDKYGRLTVFFCQAGSSWNTNPYHIGVINPAPAPTSSNPHPPTTGNYPESAPMAVSQQFGTPNPQTDVFLVDSSGNLNVLWVVGSGGWSPKPEILVNSNTRVSFPVKNAHVAASQRYGVPGQTDVYAIDNSGTLNVFSVQDAGEWGAGVAIAGPPTVNLNPGAPIAVSQRYGIPFETDVYVADKTGQIYMFSCYAQNPTNWVGPTPIGPAGLAPSKNQVDAPGAFLLASAQFGVLGQTDLFVINQGGTNGPNNPGWPTVVWVEGQGDWSTPQALVTEV